MFEDVRDNHPGVANASVEFDDASLQPTFRLIHVWRATAAGIDMPADSGLDAALVLTRRRLVFREEQAARYAPVFTAPEERWNQNTRLRYPQLPRGVASFNSSAELESKSARAEGQRQRELRISPSRPFEGFEKELRKWLKRSHVTVSLGQARPRAGKERRPAA